MEKDLTTSHDTGYIPKQKQTRESSTVLFRKVFLKVNQVAHVSLSPEKTL